MANEFKVKKGLIVYSIEANSTVLDVQGVNGQLFSITDSLTGDLFKVSDISGMPILNVHSSGLVSIDGSLAVDSTTFYVDGSTNYVGIGTSTPSRKLSVNGIFGVQYSDALELMYANPTATGLDFAIKDAASTVDFRIDSRTGQKVAWYTGGNFGIGTAAPSSYGHGGTNKTLQIHNSNTGLHSQSHVILSTSATAAGTSIGTMTWVVDGTTSNQKMAGYVGMQTTANSSGSISARMSFATTETGTLAEKMVILPNGNVGIGTAIPDQKLTVLGNIHISGSGNTGIYLDGYTPSTSANIIVNGANNFIFKRPGQGADGSSVAFQFQDSPGNALVTILQSGNVGIGTSVPTSLLTLNKVSGEVGILLEGNGTDVGMFKVANAGTNHAVYIGTISNNEVAFYSNNTERMRIANDGKIGINRTSLSYTLDVNGTGRYSDALLISHGNQPNARLKLNNTSSTGNRVFSIVAGIHNVGQNGLSIHDSAADATRIVIDNNGDIGINTNTPSAKLTVNGNSNVLGDFYATGAVSAYGEGSGGSGGMIAGVYTYAQLTSGITVTDSADNTINAYSGTKFYYTLFGASGGSDNYQLKGSSGTLLTLPTASTTLVGTDTSNVFTNKTFDTGSTGNIFRINGTQITAITGTGSVVLSTSPTLNTSILGSSTFSAFTDSTSLTVGFTGSVPSTLNIATGAVASGNTKTINIGTGGVTGSITNIIIGSGNNGTTTLQNNLTINKTISQVGLSISGIQTLYKNSVYGDSRTRSMYIQSYNDGSNNVSFWNMYGGEIDASYTNAAPKFKTWKDYAGYAFGVIGDNQLTFVTYQSAGTDWTPASPTSIMSFNGNNVTIHNTLTVGAINTGQGSTELFLMNQNVRTIDPVTFAGITSTSNVNITGTLYATAKSFLIDHPTKTGMKLQYGSLESPYHGVRLTGEGVVINKECKVILPEYIKKLIREKGTQVQITNKKHSRVLWVEEININKGYFIIKSSYVGKYEFYWSFTGVRNDVDELVTEFKINDNGK